MDITQLTIKKDILDIKLRDITMANKSHNKTGGINGHWNHGSERPMLLLKTTCHKTHLVVLKWTIKASLNLVDPLVSNGASTGRNRTLFDVSCTQGHHVATLGEEQHHSKKMAQ
jgi:hypothetical protein